MSDLNALRKEAKRVYKSRDFGAAAALYAKIAEQAPQDDPDALVADRMGYASALASLSRLDEAAVQIELALEHAPADPRLRQKLGEVLSRLGRHGDALAQFEEATRLEPDAAEHHWKRALELRALGRQAEAGLALQRCLQIDPNHTEAQIFQLENVLLSAPERDGQSEEARQDMARAGADADDDDPGAPARPEAFWAPPSATAPGRRHPLWLIVVEALVLLAIALWLRNQLG